MDDFGIISRNEHVRKWALNTPKCPKCNFFITAAFSGPKNDCIWPMCSNSQCELQKSHTFIRPEVENN